MKKYTVTKTSEFFGEESPLKLAQEHGGRTYEDRPQQREMAEAIAQALATNKHICVEAPTGVGKSFAYLIPALFQAYHTQSKVIISTHTINLQEQLINKDLKILKELMPFKFKAVITKGRENYVCLRRLDEAWHNPEEFLFTDDNMQELNRLKKWAVNTVDGTRSDINPIPEPRVWMQVCCEPGNCSAQKCKFFKNCYFMKMKINMSDADLIITNHSLFFVDMAMKATEEDVEGILPKFSAVIFDEAHTIEESAANHLGVRVSSGGFFHTLNRLYLPGRDKDRGLLAAHRWQTAQNAITRLRDRAENFFEKLTEWVEMQKENPLRYTVPGHIPHVLHPELCEVDAALKEVLDLENSSNKAQEISSLKDKIYEYALALQVFLDMSEPEFVYWFETKEHGSGRVSLTMMGVPVEVGQTLHTLLFNRDYTVITTSATLAVNHRLNYFLDRIGAGNIDSLILSSPFNYEEQVEIYIPFEMPHPNNTAQFLPLACQHIETFIKKTDGRAMVLFTSYSMMRTAATELADFFREKDYHLLMQGDKLSNSAIIDKFQTDDRTIIFGTSSFWTGIDIPGKNLSNVIIVRIPFAVPSFPLNQARIERIEARGGNSFREYSLPEAILKFRQGFGRLIRSKTDHGIVVILDNRIITTNYGQQFLDSLPTCTRKTF